MTLETAVEILNEHGHRHASDWEIHPPGKYGGRTARAQYGVYQLTEVEAVAVAEKLERDATAVESLDLAPSSFRG